MPTQAQIEYIAGIVPIGVEGLNRFLQQETRKIQTSISVHFTAPDPHTQYLLESGGAITGNFTVTGNVAFTGGASTFGAFGATPVTKPTVTGSWAGNAAGASLAAALASLGWITNSTTP